MSLSQISISKHFRPGLLFMRRCVTKRNPYFVIVGSGMVVIDKVISCHYKIHVSPKPPPAVTPSLDQMTYCTLHIV